MSDMFSFLGESADDLISGTDDTNKVPDPKLENADLTPECKAVFEAAMKELDEQETALTESVTFGVGLTESPKFRRKKASIKLQRQSRAAMLLARSANDPMFEKLRLHYTKFRELRAAIRAKYAARAKSLVARPGDKDDE